MISNIFPLQRYNKILTCANNSAHFFLFTVIQYVKEHIFAGGFIRQYIYSGVIFEILLLYKLEPGSRHKLAFVEGRGSLAGIGAVSGVAGGTVVKNHPYIRASGTRWLRAPPVIALCWSVGLWGSTINTGIT